MAPKQAPSTRPSHRRGETTSVHNQGANTDASVNKAGQAHPVVDPALPHERDESASHQDSNSPDQQAIGEKAHADATGSTQDTDRGPVLEDLYERYRSDGRAAPKPRR